MRPILLLIAACGFAACITDPTPDFSPYCYAPGDTSGYAPLLQAKDSVIVACLFTVATKQECYSFRVTRYTRADCVEGTKWKG